MTMPSYYVDQIRHLKLYSIKLKYYNIVPAKFL